MDLTKLKMKANEENFYSVWFQVLWQVCIFSSDDIIFKKLQINKYFSKLIKLTCATKSMFIFFSNFEDPGVLPLTFIIPSDHHPHYMVKYYFLFIFINIIIIFR